MGSKEVRGMRLIVELKRQNADVSVVGREAYGKLPVLMSAIEEASHRDIAHTPTFDDASVRLSSFSKLYWMESPDGWRTCSGLWICQKMACQPDR